MNRKPGWHPYTINISIPNLNNWGTITYNGSPSTQTGVTYNDLYYKSILNLCCFPENFINSIAYCNSSSDSEVILNLGTGNDTWTITFPPNSQYGVFSTTSNSNVILNTSDDIWVNYEPADPQNYDQNIQNISITLVGQVYIPPFTFTLLPTLVFYSSYSSASPFNVGNAPPTPPFTASVGGVMVDDHAPIVVGLTGDYTVAPTEWAPTQYSSQEWSADVEIPFNFWNTYSTAFIWVQYEDDYSQILLGQLNQGGLQGNFGS